MRPVVLATAALAAGVTFTTLRRVNAFTGCELVGHTHPHWVTPTLRRCDACGTTWRREIEPEGVTTTNATYGW